MSNYKGHLVGGMASYLIILSLLRSSFNPTFITSLEWLLFALIGSLFPDIDTKSMGQKVFYRFVFVLFAFLIILKKVELLLFLSLISLVPLLVKHRGLFHKLWFILLIPLSTCLYFKYYFPGYLDIIIFNSIFFIAGVVSHLILDFGIKGLIRR